MYVARPELRGAEAKAAALRFPSYRGFVDDALFHPRWGYYSTGQVRFGYGGHYDTFPLALSPLFGRMVADYAFQLWRKQGKPRHFEICELGAGNGQLCLDVLIRVAQRREGDELQRRFAQAFAYRIIERSPQLIRRQRLTLGALAKQVTWTRADLTQEPAPGAPFGTCGMIFANEVLDCLSHHKVVQRVDGTLGVIFVVPSVRGRAVPRRGLAAAMLDDSKRQEIRFEEIVLPLDAVAGLRPFLQRHYPEFFDVTHGYPPYFACPEVGTLVRRAAALYRRSQTLWIDYGELRDYHMRTPEKNRVFAGCPRSGAGVFDNPGWDDITFLVDFSVVAAEAQHVGRRVVSYGPQHELATRTGVVFDRAAHKEILQHRMVGWLLSISGVGSEGNWRRSSLTWSPEHGKGGTLRNDVRRAIQEFTGKRSTYFKMMIIS